MFFIESAGFFVLLMYERFGMGVGVEMGICINIPVYYFHQFIVRDV